jgi:Tfp pilus assembly protein PilV
MMRIGSRGTSLLEVLCGITLFALVASGVSALATGSLRHTIRNRHGTAATMLAQQQLENLRGLAYTDIAASTSSTIAAGQSYAIDTAVTADSPAAGMKQITVTVTWTGPEGMDAYAVRTIFTAVTS